MSTTSSSRTESAWATRRWTALKRGVRVRTPGSYREQMAVRRRLAERHLAGAGLEIGPLHMPLGLPRGASVRYVDRMSLAGLRAHYPELRDLDLVAPDIVDDGELLSTIPDASVDFVIANHFLEHTEDPLRTLIAHARVVRPGGTLYYAVPDKRETFDRDREITPIDHLRRDHEDGPAWSRPQHYAEWARHVEQAPDAQVAERAAALDAESYSIHFHVFTADSFLDLVRCAQTEFGAPVELEAIERNGHEFVVVLKRR